MLLTAAVIPFMLTSACESVQDEMSSTSVEASVVVDTTAPVDTVPTFQEPPVPEAGGTGLPDIPGDSGSEDIDCDNAEELCESGEWACDDIADYCDIGPDGGELPDDWDWDQ